jgi:hypothetical protein
MVVVSIRQAPAQAIPASEPWPTSLKPPDGVFGMDIQSEMQLLGYTVSLERNAPEPRDIEPPEKGRVVAIPLVGGLHHRYTRAA